MKCRLFVSSLVLAGLLIGSVTLLAQEEKGQPAAGADQEAMMKEWAKWAMPAEMHKHLDKMVGTWTATMKMSMGPDEEPMSSAGTATMSWVLGGRWIKQEYRGEMMGMPFEGIGMTGYDNFKKIYVGTWVENMTTAMISSTGSYDSTKKEFRFSGTMDEPMTGERDKKFRYTWKWTGADTHLFEMYDNIPGKGEVKVFEIAYTRAKS